MSIRLENIAKNYGQNKILKNISLDIKGQEFLALVGPSGCGKSTLLRVIAGLESPDEGAVFIDEKNVVKTKPAHRNLAMVFQSYALYPHLSVRENMKTPLKLRDLTLLKDYRCLDESLRAISTGGLKNKLKRRQKPYALDSCLIVNLPIYQADNANARPLGGQWYANPALFLWTSPYPIWMLPCVCICVAN